MGFISNAIFLYLCQKWTTDIQKFHLPRRGIRYPTRHLVNILCHVGITFHDKISGGHQFEVISQKTCTMKKIGALFVKLQIVYETRVLFFAKKYPIGSHRYCDQHFFSAFLLQYLKQEKETSLQTGCSIDYSTLKLLTFNMRTRATTLTSLQVVLSRASPIS